MSNTILLKKSSTANAVPLAANLALGEVALNYTDGNLFYKDGGGVVNLLVSNKFVSVTGNITGGNLNAAGLSLSGNVVSALVSAANITTTANISGGYILGNGALLTGVITSVANINLGTSNVTVVSSGGNVTVGVGGTSNVAVFATTGEYITGVLSASGNVTGGNLITSAAVSAASVSASGNVTGGNLITSAAVSAVSVSASGNITGGNILGGANVNATLFTGTTVSVTGNVTGGNILGGANVNATLFTGTTVSVTGNVTGGNVNTNTLVGTATTVKSTGDLNLSATGNVVLNSKYINGVLTPVQDTDAANKGYVDSIAQGLDPKASVAYATASALSAYTYNNGTSGVGATITANANGALSIDGSTPSASERVLVKNETAANAPYNGIYVVTTVGSAGAAFVLTRATDFDNGSPSGEIPGAFTFVEAGSTNADTGWVCTTNAPVTMGTTDIVFAQFSGAGSYTANTSAGLSLTGTVFSAKVDNTTTAFDGGGNIIVKASANLTTPNIGAATGTSLSTTGTITGGNLAAGTGTISTSGNITGGNLNAAGLSLSSNVVSALNVTGNITGNNINGVSGVFSAGVQVLTVNDTVDGGTY